MEIKDACDDILKFCLSNQKRFRLKGDKETKELSHIPLILQNQALNQLSTESPPFLSRIGTTIEYLLTGDGEDFANKGGYAGKRKLEEIESIQTKQDRDLIRLVNQSVLDTNKSIIETNKSVDLTNKSVFSLNEQTKQIYRFQKRTTFLTLVLAGTALILSIFTFYADKEKSDLLKIIENQIQTQSLLQKRIELLNDSIRINVQNDIIRLKDMNDSDSIKNKQSQ